MHFPQHSLLNQRKSSLQYSNAHPRPRRADQHPSPYLSHGPPPHEGDYSGNRGRLQLCLLGRLQKLLLPKDERDRPRVQCLILHSLRSEHLSDSLSAAGHKKQIAEPESSRRHCLPEEVFSHLSRFKFTRYNGQFQAFSHNAPFCSWTLFDGSSDSETLGAYSTSKNHLNFKEDQLDFLRDKIKQLRAFSKQFFQKNSVLALHPNNFKTKDMDIIVKVLKLSQQGYTLTNGGDQLFLSRIDSQVHEGDICKLRSVVRFQKSSDKLIVIKNKYTSLLRVRNNSYDAKWFYRNHQVIKSSQEVNIYTNLKDILTLPLSQCKDKHYNIKVEVLDVSPGSFRQALCYYHKETHTVLHEKPSQEMLNLLGYIRPIYKIKFVCSDYKDLKEMVEIFLYSYDSKCSDLLPRVNLEEDINEFSNFQHEDYFYRQKIEEIMTAEYVTMAVEVLVDQTTKSRALRVVKISEIY